MTTSLFSPCPSLRRSVRPWQHLIVLASSALLSLGAIAVPARAADEVAISIPFLGEFDLGIDSLARYAATGEVDRDLARYLGRLEPEQQEQLRAALQAKADLDGPTLYRLATTPLGEGVLRRLGTAIRTGSRKNGYLAIRAAAVNSALSPEGLTLINLMRRFPSSRIFIDTDTILEVAKQLETLVAYRDATVRAIATQAAAEAAAEPGLNFAAAPDLREPGPFVPRQELMEVRAPGFFVGSEEVAPYTYTVEVYLPDSDLAAPTVILSHGFASSPSHFRLLARHLASHGYVVAVPAHTGSNFDRQLSLLAGRLNNIVEPVEFVRRPRELSLALDRLAADTTAAGDWRGQPLDLDRVGVVGYSFGGYTALAIAGAPLTRDRIAADCTDEEIPTLNLSLLLQCRALPLLAAEELQDLYDPRIQAAIAINPIGSTLFGLEGLSQIEVPVLTISSSHDVVAAAVPEQIHPFAGLGDRPNWQLALLVPGTHFSTSPEEDLEQIPPEIRGPRADLGRGYLNALSLAFFGRHLGGCQVYAPYLGAAYGQYLSEPDLALYAISSLPPERLVTAYGRKPPEAVVPELFRQMAPTAASARAVSPAASCPSLPAQRSDRSPTADGRYTQVP